MVGSRTYIAGVQGLEFGLSGFRVQGLGFSVLGFRVPGFNLGIMIRARCSASKLTSSDQVAVQALGAGR